MVRAVDDVYSPDYVVTEYTQPAPVATTVHVTSSHHNTAAVPPRQYATPPPYQGVATPPRPVVQSTKVAVSDHVMLSHPPISL